MTDAATRAGIAARRSALYWLLADFVLTPPDRAFVERLQGELKAAPDCASALALRLEEVRRALPRPDDAPGIERLAVEHTRLFGGLRAGCGLPPPLETMRHDGSAAPETVAAIDNFYSDTGFNLTLQGVPADHLGTELRFMALLCHREMQAWQGGRTAEAKRALGRQRDFMQHHLGRWAPRYWRLAAADSQHHFYRAAAMIALDAASASPALVEELLA